jgi:hypothetical protein
MRHRFILFKIWFRTIHREYLVSTSIIHVELRCPALGLTPEKPDKCKQKSQKCSNPNAYAGY